MSVATQLGLNDVNGELLAAARYRWTRWQGAHPVLEVCADLLDVVDWIPHASAAEADGVLLALAELSAADGGDDPAATGALAWLLLPGACRLAFTLSRYDRRIDEVVAAQLWIEARSVNWRTGRAVAANVLMNTRKGVLRDLGVPSSCRGRDRAWGAVVLVEDMELLTQPALDSSAAASEHVYDLLTRAVETGLLSARDCRCLLDLAVAAGHAPGSRVKRGYVGLLGQDATHVVAREWGVSASTVSRRARRAARGGCVA